MPEPKKKKGIAGLSRNQMVMAGAVVGLVFYMWYKQKQAAARGRSDTVGTLPDKMPGGADSATTPIGPTPPVIDSLTSWMSHVQSWANTMGFDSATVQNALQHYSIGQCLNPAEYKIINTALGLFGQPPNAPYQGVVQCQPAPGPPDAAAVEPFLGSGYGPPGYKVGDESHPSATESAVIRGLDGNCYQWLANPNVSAAAGGAGQVIYLEIAPHTFLPNLTPVPVGTAAQYIRTTCPAPGGMT